jgi:adenylylsulfate kinase-like enzyme
MSEFVEVFVDASLVTAKKRVSKNVYTKIGQGVLAHFTGSDSEYEIPEHPELIINTDQVTLAESMMLIFNWINK